MRTMRCSFVVALVICAAAHADPSGASAIEDLSDYAQVRAASDTHPAAGAVPAEAGRDIGMSDYGVSLVGHAHIDLAYRWRWNETVHRVGPDTFRGVLELMKDEPGFTFAQSQMALYDAVRREHPALYAEIKERIEEGRWRVVGGTWVESDMMFPAGESFIRQLLVGNEFAREELGVENIDILWVPDSFCGHADTLPKILSGCGIEYYLFQRGAPPDKQVFWWESPNGSKLLAYGIQSPYNLELDKLTRQTLPLLKGWFEKASGVTHTMMLFGIGDHGGGPRAADIRAMRALSETPGAPRLMYDTPADYFEREIAPRRAAFPVHRGPLTGLTQISYASQARVKQGNRRCENLLLTAEKFSTIGTFLQRKPSYPRVDFSEAWKKVLFNQFHDILPGTANGRVFDDAEADQQWALTEGRALLQQGLECIAARVDTRGDGIPLLVFNPASWTRTDVVEATITFPEPTDALSVRDSHGRGVPFQRVGGDGAQREWRIVLLAEDVPSIGYRLLRCRPGERVEAATGLRGSVDVLENEFLIVRLTPAGTLANVYDKAADREILSGEANELLLQEEMAGSSSWKAYFGPNRLPVTPVGVPELVEDGPVRATVRSRFRFEDSLFILDTILYAKSPRVDFVMDAEWRARDVTLLVTFPTTVDSGTATFEKPYGFAERGPDGERQCAQQWIDLSSDDHGLSLLNDSTYEFYIEGNTLTMGTLRGPRDMDPRMDEGRRQLRYALYPHEGSWKHARTVRHARVLNNPLIAFQESRHGGELASWGARRNDVALPEEHSFVSVSADNVMVPVVKLEQGAWSVDGAVIVRVYETQGRPATCELRTPFAIEEAVETNHLERVAIREVDFTGDTIALNLQPRELKTFKIRFAGPG